MKTIEIKNVLKADLLLVEVPGVYEIIHHDNGIIAVLDSVVKWEIKGSYTLLGKPDEISEEDAAELVESFESESEEFKGETVFKNYKNDIPNFWFATESLLSAIETQVYWENPHGIWSGTDGRPTMIIDGADFNSAIECYNFQKKWDKAQSRTFDRNRTLIFKKN